MSTVFNILYLVVFLSYIMIGSFIVYHIVRYSINKRSSLVMLILFLFVAVILVFINVQLYKAIDFNTILNPNFL